jgi:hypothetical protein
MQSTHVYKCIRDHLKIIDGFRWFVHVGGVVPFNYRCMNLGASLHLAGGWNLGFFTLFSRENTNIPLVIAKTTRK